VADVTEWDQAACKGQEIGIFFDHEDVRGEKRAASLAIARGICAQCRIRRTCLNYAIDTGQQFGVWGGLTAAERTDLVVASNRGGIVAPHRAAS
jgi:WhiB family redox-sensing transcriptional regulator